MIVARFNSVREVEEARPKRTQRARWPYGFRPKQAYLYLVAAHDHAKIGATINPVGRIRFIAGLFNRVESIVLVGPLREWRAIETSLARLLRPHAIKGAIHHECAREWFKLPPLFYDSLKDCFVKGCTDESVARLTEIINAPPSDYQI